MAEDTPLSTLGISRRAQGALAKANIVTLEQAESVGWAGLRAYVGVDTIAKLQAASRGDSAPGSRAEREKMRRDRFMDCLAAGDPEEVAKEKAERAVAVYFGGEDA